MNKKYFVFIITLFNASFLFCQSNNNCNKVKTGIFYFYPSTSNRKFIIERTNAVQKEIDITNNDTTLWKITWQNNCFFSLKFLNKTKPIPDDEKAFYNIHSTVIKIKNVTKDYYIFSGGLDSLNAIGNIQDTVWFREKEISK